MPGTNCPVSATIISGKAIFNMTCQLKSGLIQTGVASPITRASLRSSPDAIVIVTPTTNTASTA